MSQVIKAALVSVLALGLNSGCAIKMENRMPFNVSRLDHYNIEAQNLIPGTTKESFQISVPRGEVLDQLEMRDGSLYRYSISLKDYGIGTSHFVYPLEDGFFLTQRAGLYIFSADGDRIIWKSPTHEFEPSGGFFPGDKGELYAIGEGRSQKSTYEVYRISENSGAERTLTLPFSFDSSPIWKFPTKDGILTYWSGPLGAMEEVSQFFTWAGQEKTHPLAKALNVLAISQVQISGSTSRLYRRGAVLSRTKDAWGVLPHQTVGRFPGSDLFLLSAMNDSTHLQPIVLEPKAPQLKNEVSFLLAHPSLNLALIGVKRQGETSLYMIHVKASEKFYNPTVYRLNPFPEVEWPVLSHNGNVLAFSMREQGVTKIVMARLEDILSDINRRYPEAKLSMAALESEVK